jgi:uncharacterized membrane protein (DUF2068 family)
MVGISILFPNRLMDRLWELNKPAAEAFRAIGWIAGVFLLALSLGTALAAVGLLRRKKWAWWFAIILFAIDGSGDVVGLFATGDWLRAVFGASVSASFLYFLARRPVRDYFAGDGVASS